MLLTVTSDASFCPDSKKAGYGFLISSNVGRFSKSGKLKDTKNPCEAELKSIANAMCYIATHKELWGISKVIFNIDFIAAKDFIEKNGMTSTGKKKHKGKRYRQIVGVITKYIGELRKRNPSVKIEYRWVESHTGKSENRSKANEYVDKLAVMARKNQ